MFVTVKELKDYSGNHNDIDDLMDIYIGSSIEIIEQYIGYSLQESDYITFGNISTDGNFLLESKPVTSIMDIKVDGNAISSSEYLVKDEIVHIYDSKFFNKPISIEYKAGFFEQIPNLIKLTILRVGTLLLTESDGNIGITSKSFQDSGSRTFTNFTNYEKYLEPIKKFKLREI